MPEMRLFWLFSVLVIFILVVDFLFIPRIWQLISLVTLVGAGAVIFINSLRTASTNYSLQLERNRQETVLNSLREGVIAYDDDFRVLMFNAAAEQIFEVHRKDVLGRTFSLDLAKNQRFRLLAQVFFPSLVPVVVRRSDPGVYPQMLDMSFENPTRELRVVTSRILDARGLVLGFIKVVNDRTREIQLLKSKSEFVTIASHQLRAPITAVSWALENLQKEKLSASAQPILNDGLRASIILNRAVDDLLNVAKIEEGRFGYTFQAVNLVDFVNKILADALSVAKDYKVNIYLTPSQEKELIVTADPEKLGVAITDILDNAIKYNVPNGQVVLTLQRQADKPYILFSVKDSGIGIPPDDIGKLFTKFYRSEAVKKIDPSGSGLGLYIAKNIILRHGGQVWAESVLNRGTTVYFTLPTDAKLIPPKEIVYGEE